MKPNKLIILIAIALIATLGLVILVRENQHNETIATYQNKENQLRKELKQSIANNAESEEMYLELKEENIELRGQSDIIWDKFTITAYTQYDDGCNNITSIGLNLDKPWTEYFNFVAVDPDVIPYGKTVFIKLDGEIIEALAVDCGGKIKGNHIDFYCKPSEVSKIGRREDIPVGIIK